MDAQTPKVEAYANVKRIGLCVPMRGMIDANFMQCYLQIMLYFMKQPGIIPMPFFSEGVPLDKARNDIVRAAVIAQCDYYFWIDADVMMNEAAAATMWETIQQPSIDIVSGIYYERAPPFNPVLRKESDFGKMRVIDDYPRDKLFTADGVGFGCVMMKKAPMVAMVNKFKGKVFLFSEECSEDLFFCRRVRELGFKIWVNPSVQCSHGGAPVSAWHYLHYKMDEYADMKELADYTKENPVAVYRKACDGVIQMAHAWKDKFGERTKENTPAGAAITQPELDEFYRTCDYRYDLTAYWSHNRRMREHVLGAAAVALSGEVAGQQVLDYGCGIGDYGLSVLEDTKDVHVDFFDINTMNLDYVSWRVQQRHILDPLWSSFSTRDAAHIQDKDYKLVFCLDVLEHVADPAEHLKWIRAHMKPDGILLCFVAPANPLAPEHISFAIPEDHGFLKTGEYSYIRDDSPLALEYKRQMANLVVPTAKVSP